MPLIAFMAAEPCQPASDAGWLNGPRATVIAALIAVVGAAHRLCGSRKPYAPGVLSRNWRETVKETGIRHIKLHAARHTRATLMHHGGKRVQKVGIIPAHSCVLVSVGPMTGIEPAYAAWEADVAHKSRFPALRNAFKRLRVSADQRHSFALLAFVVTWRDCCTSRWQRSCHGHANSSLPRKACDRNNASPKSEIFSSKGLPLATVHHGSASEVYIRLRRGDQ